MRGQSAELSSPVTDIERVSRLEVEVVVVKFSSGRGSREEEIQ